MPRLERAHVAAVSELRECRDPRGVSDEPEHDRAGHDPDLLGARGAAEGQGESGEQQQLHDLHDPIAALLHLEYGAREMQINTIAAHGDPDNVKP